MSNEPRDSFYKRSSKTLLAIKQTNKASVLDRQNKSRENIITRKRLKVNSQLAADELLKLKWSEGQDKERVLEAVKGLKKGDKLKALTDLHKLFANHQNNVNEFLRQDGLQPLHSCFKSLNVDVLHTSAWCVVNLTAVSAVSTSVLMGLAPTLLQFLKGSDFVMQELCAWGLANMAGDCASNVDILHRQGCTDALLDLLDMCDHHVNEERSRSVLFALINMARGSSSCAQRMLEKGIHKTLQILLKEIMLDSTLNFELGWLFNSVYSRSDGFGVRSLDYPMITRLVCDRLNHLVKGSNCPHRDQVCFPFIRCLRNLVGLSPLTSRIILNDLQTFDTIIDLLTSGPNSLKQEVLALVNNCIVDVASRVLLTCQPVVLSTILSLCGCNQPDLSLQALEVVQTMARTSSQLDVYLLHHGILSVMSQTLSNAISDIHNDSPVIKVIVGVISDLVSSQLQLARKIVNSDQSQNICVLNASLKRLASLETVDIDIANKARHLMELLELT